MNEVVSIIIPIYNSERFLAKCLTSVCNQSYNNLEIILVDDKSTDFSGVILNEFAQKDDRIKVIVNDVNSGVSYSRNKGVTAATGDYIQFVDSDDEIAVNMTETLVNGIKDYNSDLAICNAKMFVYSADKIENETILCKLTEYDECAVNRATFLARFGQNMYPYLICVGVVWNKLYKRSILENNGINFMVDMSYGEDLIFNTTIYSYINRVTLINECLYCYNVHSNSSLAQKYKEDNLKAHVILGNAMRDLLVKNNAYSGESREQMHNWLANNIVESLFEMYLPACSMSDKERLKQITESISEEIVNDAFVYGTGINEIYLPFVKLFLEKDAAGVLLEANKCYHEHLDLFKR